jgi:hypothetical protein
MQRWNDARAPDAAQRHFGGALLIRLCVASLHAAPRPGHEINFN